MELLLDGREISSESAFHGAVDRAARSVGFHGYGANLDALWDVLTAIFPAPVEVRWINAAVSHEAMGQGFDEIARVLREAETEMGPSHFRLRLDL